MFPSVTHRMIAIAIVLHAVSANAFAENEVQCGSLENAFGPMDYRVTPNGTKYTVESAHFTSKVEQLIGGNTSSDPAGDIDYTLRAFPNHPRALNSLMKWGFKKKSDHPKWLKWPIWCYFDRAIRFRPDDAQVRMLYGLYLQRKGKSRDSLLQLEEARKLAGENANIHYNIGLVYLDLGEFNKSLDHAHRAYDLGFPLEGLRNRLKRAGKWREPAPAQPVAEPVAEPVAVSPATPEPKASDDLPQE